jgi:3-oxoacyl-[acyl-carrier-protein] synthase II
MVSTAVGSPVISAWSAISPWGRDGADFTAGLRSGRRTATRLDPDEWDVPFREACLVPGFDIREVLGRKGTRSMDRVSGLAVAAVGQLLTDGAGERLAGVHDDAGLALGTSTGSAQSMMDFTRDSLVGDRPYLVDPARFPNTVMNCAAGQSAIWHGLKGPNTTLAGGRATGLLALQYGLRLHKAGRARTLLCGAVEEFSRARAWLEWHARRGDTSHAVGSGDTAERDAAGTAPVTGTGTGLDRRVLGEGAVAWLLEPAEQARTHGRRGIAVPLGLRFGFALDVSEIRRVLATSVRSLLDSAGVGPTSITAVSASQTRGPEAAAEQAALEDVFGGHRPLQVGCAEAIGDTYAASAAFQVAAVLAFAETEPTAAGGHVLVTSVETNGVVGAALLRLAGDDRTAA